MHSIVQLLKPTVITLPTRKIPENPVEKILINDDFVADNLNVDSIDIDSFVQYICYKAKSTINKKANKNGEPTNYKQTLQSAEYK